MTLSSLHLPSSSTNLGSSLSSRTDRKAVANPLGDLQRWIHQVLLPGSVFAQFPANLTGKSQKDSQASRLLTYLATPTNAGLTESGKTWAAASCKAMGCIGYLIKVESNMLILKVRI